MGIKEAIDGFPEQFSYAPVVENEASLGYVKHAIAVGMGGSHLAADIMASICPEKHIMVHTDYGLPAISDDILRESIVICNSYSGNTEEVLDAFDVTEKRGALLAVITTGGKLLLRAKEKGVAFVQLPHIDIQPRMALGFHVRALMKLLGMDEELTQTEALHERLDTKKAEKEGRRLARALRGKVPVIYSSRTHAAIAYNWKIKFNETGKIPAFCNTFPELNHNEMTGFENTGKTAPLNEPFHFIFLKDLNDDPRIQKRMDVCRQLYEKRGFGVDEIIIEGKNNWEKAFSSLLVADFAALNTALAYEVEPEQVPMVEEFKKMI
ncbi:MAG: hypothetical protein COU47_01730 [Candidatus Niyogibacteria bacterium CG10_big_fil_rev_8_21_14_0_10_46_36]|uniref:SIS domain-containing protein n=1 Tax=Candidatus Niyogibacteria bacterium CG10_big_fil_rev_8_21_14_0_10_46_36 TaxID=1974726 RepID=A0A2H0TE00_9BACT|nr:MAG: hypothetical protein COU47_01730 [Candidatus Niyogibacteria bacterium CG10_big_fil_rev_8_21_14_0_10_46_36]